MSVENFTIGVAVNDMEILRKNLLASPSIFQGTRNQLLIKHRRPSASLAYNSVLDEAENEIIIFAHQDVYLPDPWFVDLRRWLSYLKAECINWGVLGCFGCRKSVGGGLGRVYTTGIGFHGVRLTAPEPVETLDEIVLIVRKSSGLRFDPSLPHFHLYGADICLSATDKGMACYALPGVCIHNTNQIMSLPEEFYECYYHIKRKWRTCLPIRTSCVRISLADSDLRFMRLREIVGTALRKTRPPHRRVEDPRALLVHEIHP
jgi:hypothetical protein